MKYSNPIILEVGEVEIYNARKHWFLILVELVALFFALMIPIVLWILLRHLPLTPEKLFPEITTYHAIFFGAIWFLIIWIMSFVIITDYVLDVVKITNRRIIDIDQKGMFRRNVATIRLESVQDITIESHGIIATLLNFGNLSIQSAGELGEFKIKGVRQPGLVKEIMMREQGKRVAS